MKKVCAWHKIYFGFELVMCEVLPLDDKSITHGMCDECYEYFNKEISELPDTDVVKAD